MFQNEVIMPNSSQNFLNSSQKERTPQAFYSGRRENFNHGQEAGRVFSFKGSLSNIHNIRQIFFPNIFATNSSPAAHYHEKVEDVENQQFFEGKENSLTVSR